LANLTTLADVKTYMGLTGTELDDKINLLIPAISAAVERYCDRHFINADYRQFILTEGGDILYLPEYPVNKLKRLVTGLTEVMRISTSLAGAKSATVEVIDGHLFARTWGDAEVETDIDLSSETTLAAIKTALELVSGWSVEVISGYENHLSADLVDEPGQPALSSEYASFYIPDYDSLISGHHLTAKTGRVKLTSGKFPETRIFAEWNAGLGANQAALPADLTELVTAMVADAVREAGSDKGMKSEKLGDYSYTRFDNSVSVDEFVVERYSEQLIRWRRVSIG